MIRIDVLDEQYDVITEWSELTLERFLKVQEIANKAPKKLKDVIGYIYMNDKEALESLELSKNESLKTFPKFYGDMLGVLADIPKKVINQIDRDSREQFFNMYLIKFAIGVLYTPVDVELTEEDYFEFEGLRYYYPRAKKIVNQERPMGYISTIQFTEAADLDVYMASLDENDYSVLANITAILCVKGNEEYDEDIMLERAEKFKGLTMDIVWNVFFYLDELLTTYTKTIVPYSLEKAKQNMQVQLKRQE